MEKGRSGGRIRYLARIEKSGRRNRERGGEEGRGKKEREKKGKVKT